MEPVGVEGVCVGRLFYCIVNFFQCESTSDHPSIGVWHCSRQREIRRYVGSKLIHHVLRYAQMIVSPIYV